jgi:hypothetical protein
MSGVPLGSVNVGGIGTIAAFIGKGLNRTLKIVKNKTAVFMMPAV